MRIAAFSFDKKFGNFRPVWYKYYSLYCDEVEIITDKVPEGADVYEKFNFVSPVLEAKMKELFERNDIVVYTDIDEFLIPNPTKYRELRDYLEVFSRSEAKYARSTGMNVVQILGEEKIDFDLPLLDQRRYWSKADFYSKVNICKGPTRFIDGMVNPVEGKPAADPDLILAHMKYIDFAEETKRGKERRGYRKFEDMLDCFLDVTKSAVRIPQLYKVV